VPLENRIDYLNLRGGQKFSVPIALTLVLATNLDPARVTDPAFLRRIGYRLHLPPPDPARYSEIFRRYAASRGLTIENHVLEALLERYRAEGRELRGCEPRDLIERVLDLGRFLGRREAIDLETLEIAWRGFFGEDVSH
jgi:chromosomal replication initiation ATPase DnaA